MMIEKDLYFLSHDGEVWAHWLSGRPSVKLGGVAEFLTAMEVYRKRSEDARKAAGEGASAGQDPDSESGQKVSISRIEERFDLTVIGKVFAVGGSREVTILDLSERGCKFRDATGKLDAEDRVTVKIGPVGPIEAVVRWRQDPMIGIEFCNPLYPSVMEHIRLNHDLRGRS
ncbi:MAG: PilZ domain-containing protein [Erythrobacter sp.]|nr:PilZ domain-containing protein [Erythrobacter sp.]